MTELEKAQKRHAKELAEAQRKDVLKALLPEGLKDGTICFHSTHTTYKLRDPNAFHYGKSHRGIVGACEILAKFREAFESVECERWRDTFLYTTPEEINKGAKNANANMDGAHVVALDISIGDRFQDVELESWFRIGSELVHLHIEFDGNSVKGLMPRWIPGTKYSQGYWQRESVSEDARKQWSTGGGEKSLHDTLYLADWPNFDAWASQYTPDPNA